MNAKKPAVRAIFFDAAGTLFHLRRSVGENYAAVARTQGVELSTEAFERTFLQAWRRAPFRRAAGRPCDDDDKSWWRDLVATMLKRMPKLPSDFDRILFFERAYAHFAQADVWTLYEEVGDVLCRLQPHYPLHVVSNFDRRLRMILRGLEIESYFRHVFISSELGVDKPSPEIFRQAVSLSGFQPAETLHAGDDPERDWAAAEKAGMQVFKLNRARNSLRDLIGELVS